MKDQKSQMIVNNFLLLPTEIRVILLFGILMLIYETVKEIKGKWRKQRQRNHK